MLQVLQMPLNAEAISQENYLRKRKGILLNNQVSDTEMYILSLSTSNNLVMFVLLFFRDKDIEGRRD